jgi:hypothetical protein
MTSSQPTAALFVTTDASGSPVTVEGAVPTSPTGSSSGSSASTTGTATAASSTSSAATSTSADNSSSDPSSTLVPSKDFPVCHDTSARPFCQPTDNQTVYVGNTYYVTWNADFFKPNSTMTVKLNYANSSQIQAWSSDEINVAWGVTTVEMQKDWLQGYDEYNLTFFALVYEGGSSEPKPYDGPNVMLQKAPADHYPPPPTTKMPNKESLAIGLPLGLGFVAIVVVGLFIGMRKKRQIGLGNIMGRRKGYGSGKSRRQRLGLGGKKGAIRLQDREIRNVPDENQYRDNPDAISPAPPRDYHVREPSLGSLVSDDDRPRGNAFRNEIERQRTGR